MLSKLWIAYGFLVGFLLDFDDKEGSLPRPCRDFLLKCRNMQIHINICKNVEKYMKKYKHLQKENLG